MVPVPPLMVPVEEGAFRLKKRLLAMSSFQPGEWRKFSRPDQSRLRRSSSLNSLRSRSSTYNPSLHFLLRLLDTNSARSGRDFEEEDGAIDRINGNGGDSGRNGFIYECDPFTRIGRQGGSLRRVI